MISFLSKELKRNVRGVPKKKVGADTILVNLVDLPEDVEYQIDSIRTFLSRNGKAYVTVEFTNKIMYLPFNYRNFFLDEVFCVDNFLNPLRGKKVNIQ